MREPLVGGSNPRALLVSVAEHSPLDRWPRGRAPTSDGEASLTQRAPSQGAAWCPRRTMRTARARRNNGFRRSADRATTRLITQIISAALFLDHLLRKPHFARILLVAQFWWCPMLRRSQAADARRTKQIQAPASRQMIAGRSRSKGAAPVTFLRNVVGGPARAAASASCFPDRRVSV